MADPSLSTTTSPPLPTSSTPAPGTISLRTPRKYSSPSPSPSSIPPPPLTWLQRTWTVTHSTLPMWRSAKNVRITYKILPGNKLDDEVTSEPVTKTWLPQPKSIKGVDSPDDEEGWGWKWRGRGVLGFVTSRWEVLGWGEDGDADAEGEKEKWVVTWFAPSLFTEEGVDVYSSRKEGIRPELYERIEGALKELKAKEVADLCGKEMRGVSIDD